MYSVYNNQATRDHIKPLINANNIHKQTVKHTILRLEESIRSLDVVYSVDNIYSWVYRVCLVLIDNRATGLYWQLPADTYTDLLDIGLTLLNMGSVSRYYMNSKNKVIACAYFLNHVLNIVSLAHNFELELVNDLQQYLTGIVSNNDSNIKGLIVLYTNIKKLDLLTGTQYKDTPGALKWCLDKLLISSQNSDLLLEVLPSFILSTGLSSCKDLSTEPDLDMLEFKNVFRHIWPDNNQMDSSANTIIPGQDYYNERHQQVENESAYYMLLDDLDPVEEEVDENSLAARVEDDWS